MYYKLNCNRCTKFISFERNHFFNKMLEGTVVEVEPKLKVNPFSFLKNIADKKLKMLLNGKEK